MQYGKIIAGMLTWLSLHTESNSYSGSKMSASTPTPSTITICLPSRPLIKSVAGRTGTVTVSSELHLPRLAQTTDSGIHIDNSIPTTTLLGAAPFSFAPCFPLIPSKIVTLKICWNCWQEKKVSNARAIILAREVTCDSTFGPLKWPVEWNELKRGAGCVCACAIHRVE